MVVRLVRTVHHYLSAFELAENPGWSAQEYAKILKLCCLSAWAVRRVLVVGTTLWSRDDFLRMSGETRNNILLKSCRVCYFYSSKIPRVVQSMKWVSFIGEGPMLVISRLSGCQFIKQKLRSWEFSGSFRFPVNIFVGFWLWLLINQDKSFSLGIFLFFLHTIVRSSNSFLRRCFLFSLT
jgi:hypothetical protein